MSTQKDLNDLYFVVAEDDADNHFRIRQSIKKNDARNIVTSVFNGSQLIDLLLGRGVYQTDSYRCPDVIILDLQMHIMNGIEALNEIRKEPGLRRIPVYTFAGKNAPQQKSSAVRLGAIKVYEMPDDPRELDRIVNEICKRESERKKGKRRVQGG